MTSVEVVRDDDNSRYEAYAGSELVGYAEFRIAGDTIIFPHTVTNPSFSGRGCSLGDCSRLARRGTQARGASGGA